MKENKEKDHLRLQNFKCNNLLFHCYARENVIEIKSNNFKKYIIVNSILVVFLSFFAIAVFSKFFIISLLLMIIIIYLTLNILDKILFPELILDLKNRNITFKTIFPFYLKKIQNEDIEIIKFRHLLDTFYFSYSYAHMGSIIIEVIVKNNKINILTLNYKSGELSDEQISQSIHELKDILSSVNKNIVIENIKEGYNQYEIVKKFRKIFIPIIIIYFSLKYLLGVDMQTNWLIWSGVLIYALFHLISIKK